MTRIEKLNLLQVEAVQALKANDYTGTVLLFTGSGKSFVKQKTIYSALDDKIIEKGDTIWLMAEEVESRKRTFFEQEIPKFKKLYGKSIIEDFNFQFHSYQSGEKLVEKVKSNKISLPKIILCDEIDSVYTPTRICIFELQDLGTRFCGFTATDAALLNVYTDKIKQYLGHWKLEFRQSDADTKAKKLTDFVNKGQCMQMFCPIVFERDFQWGLDNGLLSPFKTTLIYHTLGTREKNTLISKTKEWYGSEKEFYDFYKTLAFSNKIENGFKAIILKQKLPQFLSDLPSKIIVGKQILKCLPKSARTLFFAKKLDFLGEITPNVARDYWIIDGKVVTDLKEYKKKHGLKHVKSLGEKITTVPLLNAFDNGEITELASAQRLQRGITLDPLNTLVLYVSSKQSHAFLQMLGRLLRYKEGKIGHLILIVTRDTYEENWYEQLQEIRDLKGKLIKRIELNIKSIIDSKTLFIKNYEL
jgi:superfamily II DNA or RNA helicase